MSNQAITNQTSAVSTAAPSWLQTSAALAFGLIVLFAVGFAPMDAAHNAAHDTRHALAFPCH